MDADERRRMEAAMTKISQARRDVEAEPQAAIQTSVDDAMSKALRRILLGLALIVAAAIAIDVVRQA